MKLDANMPNIAMESRLRIHFAQTPSSFKFFMKHIIVIIWQSGWAFVHRAYVAEKQIIRNEYAEVTWYRGIEIKA